MDSCPNFHTFSKLLKDMTFQTINHYGSYSTLAMAFYQSCENKKPCKIINNPLPMNFSTYTKLFTVESFLRDNKYFGLAHINNCLEELGI